ncbi:MAG: type II toxin-antitoxin system PemK/MazF family toxin [Methylibium sp.]|nr:type II toxin-antitoxin system PemK/MazF family toxin [Methylibium sp.]
MPAVARATQPTAARASVVRGDLWAVDFEPQSDREEPGKTGRPALVLQTDALNRAGHASTIVIPGTSQLGALEEDDLFPLRVRLPAATGTGLREATDLLIDQVRAVSNRRLIRRLGSVDAVALARAEQALRWLTGV